ncbi:polyketide synthase dehydratase domain-containing protein [Streptomyces sp. M19]
MGCDHLSELALETPLVIPAQGGCGLQVALTEQQDGWAVTIHSRPDGGEVWTRHATGVLSAAPPITDDTEFGAVGSQWPPAGATAVDIAEAHATEPESPGHEVTYGPVFQGLTRAWVQGQRVWAEVALPESQTDRAGAFGMHPALLDAVLRAAVFAAPHTPSPSRRVLDGDEARLPFHVTGLVLRASGTTRVRACLTRTGRDEISVAVTDSAGEPVLSIGSVLTRPGRKPTSRTGPTIRQYSYPGGPS